MRITLSFLLFWLGVSGAGAQNFLVLEKMGTKKRYEFHGGDQIVIRLQDEKHFTPLVISGFVPDSILAGGYSYALRDIYMVKLPDRRPVLRGSGYTLMVAGVVLLAIDLINQAVVQGGGYEFTAGVAAASAGMIGVGAALYFGGRSKVKLKKWWRLRLVRI